MLKPIESFFEYCNLINSIEYKMDNLKRNDMIIFDELSKCLSSIKLEYPEYELKRVNLINKHNKYQ